MRFTILFFLLACLALSLVSASKESGHPPGHRHTRRKTVDPSVEAPKRVKRTLHLHRHPTYYYNPYVRPYYSPYVRPYYSVPAVYI